MNHSESELRGGVSPDARNWALGAHLSAFLGFVVPFGNIIAPLIIWLIKRESDPFVDDQGKEALNFNISVAIYAIASAVLTIILIGFLLLAAVVVFWFVMVVVAAIRASNGEAFRYPLSIRLIK